MVQSVSFSPLAKALITQYTEAKKAGSLTTINWQMLLTELIALEPALEPILALLLPLL